MSDQSELDRKYFLDGDRFNCPFCNRRSVTYDVTDNFSFNWSEDEVAYGYITKCNGCEKESLHLSYFSWSCASNYGKNVNPFKYAPRNLKEELRSSYNPTNVDRYFFYHQPTSFFTLDARIPKTIRELVAEADGCRRMNWLAGASGALRKAIYKFLLNQKATGESYQDQIRYLKTKNQSIAPEYFDALTNVQDMTSEELHETKDWEPWSREEFDYIVATVKAVLHEVYVVPDERKGMLARVLKLGPERRAQNKLQSK